MQGWINEWMHTNDEWFDEWIKSWIKRISKLKNEWIK